MQSFPELCEARFLERPNRFIVRCESAGKAVTAHLPNPGRLWELLLPGAPLLLARGAGVQRRTRFSVVAVLKGGAPIFLHTGLTNEAAAFLLGQGKIPGLEGAEIVRREVRRRGSRFDFLLSLEGRRIWLEVKSCTLFSRKAALFPDAVTARGRRHVEELAALEGREEEGAVLFVVHSLEPRVFLPEYHTDPDFADTLLRAREKVRILPVAVEWRRDLTLSGRVRRLPIPWEIVARENENRGAYLLVLEKKRAASLQVGKLGRLRFEKGFYVYVGSAMSNLSARIARHRRLAKKKFWHIDTLRETCDWVAGLPIRTAADLECRIARRMPSLGPQAYPGFGCSDCGCGSHLFRFEDNPFHLEAFHDLLQHFRIDRLL